MNRICYTYYNMDSDRNSVRNGAALRGGSFCICHVRHIGKVETAGAGRMKIQPLTDRRTTRQRWQMLLYGRQGQAPCGVSRENHLLCCGIFPKPCLSGSICSKGPCSSTGCQSPDIHDLNKRSMQQTIIARQSPAPAWIPVIEKKRKIRMPEPHIKLPGRGATGPVPVSTLLNPVLEICNHPDRNRLLAEFFREY